MVPDTGFVTRNGIFGATTGLVIYQISVNKTAVTRIALQNRGMGGQKFQVFLVPNYRDLRFGRKGVIGEDRRVEHDYSVNFGFLQTNFQIWFPKKLETPSLFG